MATRTALFALALTTSASLVAANARAQELPPEETPPPQMQMPEPTPAAPSVADATTQHVWVEARLGSRRWSQKSAGFGGGGFDLALGLGWQWIDVGLVGTYSATGDGGDGSHAGIWTIGPEIATRTSI